MHGRIARRDLHKSRSRKRAREVAGVLRLAERESPVRMEFGREKESQFRVWSFRGNERKRDRSREDASRKKTERRAHVAKKGSMGRVCVSRKSKDRRVVVLSLIHI